MGPRKCIVGQRFVKVPDISEMNRPNEKRPNHKIVNIHDVHKVHMRVQSVSALGSRCRHPVSKITKMGKI